MAKKVKTVVMVPQEGTVAIGLACCSCSLIFFIKPFHSRDQQLCKFIGTKRGFYIKRRFNSHRISLGHQHGLCFVVQLGRQN